MKHIIRALHSFRMQNRSVLIHPYQTEREMGEAAAFHAAKRIRELAQQQDVVSVVFATGASQLQTLQALTALPVAPSHRLSYGRIPGHP